MSATDLPPELLPLWELAAEVGLELRGTLPTAPLEPEIMTRFQAWLADGRAGEMDYLHKAAEVGADLAQWKSWGKSVALFALPYARKARSFQGGGRVARYALGKDYHNLIGRKLQKLGKRLRSSNLTGAFRAVVRCLEIAAVCVAAAGETRLRASRAHAPPPPGNTAGKVNSQPGADFMIFTPAIKTKGTQI